MQKLTPQGQQAIENISQRYGFSMDAVLSMLQSVMNGHGTMAQFSHPEFGGSGQWMQGGMTMIGDMFNNALKARVDGLCAELSGLLASQPLYEPPPARQVHGQTGGGDVSLFVDAGGSSGSWWPADLGSASSTGSQNDVRYAVFPDARRLAVEVQGRVTVYDTLDHRIGGVSQQQSGPSSVTFTSQYGVVRMSDLPIVPGGSGYPAQGNAAQRAPDVSAVGVPPSSDQSELFGQIEKLAELRERGVLSDQEFAAKKAELLQRL